MPEVIINGPEGRIEARYHHQAEKSHAPAAIILHPHPKHGGTMNNKVTYQMFKTFVDQGFSVLRFNFRGVGRSEGVYDSGVGELSDAAAALDWLQAQNPDASSFWVGGFSFGAWLAFQLLMRRPELKGFITVSPPANMYDFSFLAPCPRGGLMLQGTQDSVVSEESVASLAAKLHQQKHIEVAYRSVEGADHFFREHMEEMIDHMVAYLEEHREDIHEFNPIRTDRKRRPQEAEALPLSEEA